MKIKRENQLLTNFSVSSLTDIVMLLLIFFLLSSSFVVSPGIKVQLPRAETGETPNDKNVTISVTEKGLLYLNSRQVTLETLAQNLSAALRGDAHMLVVINADKNVTLQNTVRVIDIAKGVGAQRFMIATQPSGAQKQ